MAVRDWHSGKIGLLWGVSIVVLLILFSAYPSWERTTPLVYWLVLTSPLLFVTWRWFSGREHGNQATHQDSDAEKLIESGSTAGQPVVPQSPTVGRQPRKRVGVVERLKTPAPRSERAGYVAVGLLLGLPSLAVTIVAVESLVAGRFTTLRVAILAVALIVLMALVRRRPWAYWTLSLGLFLSWVFYVKLGITNSLDGGRDAVIDNPVANILAATFDLVSIAYLYRRRWWFGVEVPSSVPEESPKGGILVLSLIAVVFTWAVVEAAASLRQ